MNEFEDWWADNEPLYLNAQACRYMKQMCEAAFNKGVCVQFDRMRDTMVPADEHDQLKEDHYDQLETIYPSGTK